MQRVLVLLCFLAGCSAPALPPETARGGAADAPFLDFLTADQLAALNADVPTVAPDAPLAGRLARLRARAAILRGPIFSGDDRARLTGTPG